MWWVMQRGDQNLRECWGSWFSSWQDECCWSDTSAHRFQGSPSAVSPGLLSEMAPCLGYCALSDSKLGNQGSEWSHLFNLPTVAVVWKGSGNRAQIQVGHSTPWGLDAWERKENGSGASNQPGGSSQQPSPVALHGPECSGIFLMGDISSYLPTLSNPMDRSTQGLPVHHQLPEVTQTHVHWVGDATQPSHPPSSPSPSAFNLSQHQGLFKRVSSSHQVAKVLEFQPQHQSFQWIPRTDL